MLHMRRAYSRAPDRSSRRDHTGFIDLDHVPRGPAVYDLAYFLVDRIKRKVRDDEAIRLWRRLIAHVVAGYRETNQLSTLEDDALWPAMCAVQLLFAEFLFARGDRAEAELNLDAVFRLCEGGA